MRFDLHLNAKLREEIEQLATVMRAWEEEPRLGVDEQARLHDALALFEHATHREGLIVAGVDGSGDFPALTYADAFVYFTVARGTVYEATGPTGLREIGPVLDPLLHLTWLPEHEATCRQALDETFAALAGAPLREIVERSDYRALKATQARKELSVEQLVSELIRPHASDAGNLAIQLRATAELGVALRLIRQDPRPDYVLVDTTFSLPSVNLRTGSLFYEHLKRLCCVEARQRGVAFCALSKSHGLPSIELLERVARDKRGVGEGEVAEHWYLRLPTLRQGGWVLSLTEGRQVPPVGAVSYVFRFHRTTPVMRLDMDARYWREHVLGETVSETEANERHLFENLDFASHDYRAYGYPYPITAAHQRASLTQAERTTLRKQIVEAAVQAGLKPSLFRDVARATGHG
jgi:predicted DNA-binding ribbon-helix-helix protein